MMALILNQTLLNQHYIFDAEAFLIFKGLIDYATTISARVNRSPVATPDGVPGPDKAQVCRQLIWEAQQLLKELDTP